MNSWMMNREKIILLLLLPAFIYSSCSKEEENTEREMPDTRIAGDFSTAEYESNQLLNIGFDAINYASQDPDGKRSSSSFYVNGCVSATVTPAWPDTTFPKTIELDFGNGCTGADGRVRSGILTVVATGRYRTPSTNYTVTPTNFYVDGNQITGTKSVTNSGYNAANNLVYQIDVNTTIIRANGDSIDYLSTREREWINGEASTVFNSGLGAYLDDQYSITGTASGHSSAGTMYNSVITNPLIVDLSCPHVIEGTLEITPQNGAVRTIDWGNGTCDNLIEFSLGNYTVTVTI